MFKRNKTVDKYKLNKETVVTVYNEQIISGEDGHKIYKSKVTLKHELAQDKPLVFRKPGEIEDFLTNIDLEDPQQEMALDE